MSILNSCEIAFVKVTHGDPDKSQLNRFFTTPAGLVFLLKEVESGTDDIYVIPGV